MGYGSEHRVGFRLLGLLWAWGMLLGGTLAVSEALANEEEPFRAVLAAAQAQDRSGLQSLKAAGSLDRVDAEGRSVLWWLTARRDYDAMALLIELGVEVDHHDPARSGGVIDPTPFLYAGAHGDTRALRLLYEAGARTDRLNYYGGTALIPAAEKGYRDAVRYLLAETDVAVNHVNRLGWTALMEAVVLSGESEQQTEIVRLLLAHGADPAIADRDGVTALQHARRRRLDALVELLEAASPP
ncbi:ankyrin repeat domain-containing protein [Aestuariirhabdus litorea]|uniref:ankyrin repeat domain-containing protein n=1 Tax=Aestuariirhabdus litorea TaxID=2528527 RepID=UPI000F6242CE|nr:ankyrin repeat domain-containing protein [Aestuariirhabdus litorea]RWW93485.1 ankyrin repeat domain-containing protein [Endozoicomonadaceae bacterium GTF-13]